jgi:hypothetical protein
MELRKDNVILNIDEQFDSDFERLFFGAFFLLLCSFVHEFKYCNWRRKHKITEIILEAEHKIMEDLKENGD